MSFLRNLVSDLVEKRLWPVAVLLVGALVAVPFLLAGGTPAADPVATATATATTSTTPATTSTTIRVSEETTVSTLVPSGARHNPFEQPEVRRAATPDESASTPTPSEATPTTGGTTSGGATTPSTTTPPSGSTEPPSTDTDSPEPKDDENTKAIRVDLRFGEPGKTKQKRYDDVARLSALPSANEPIVIFLGVKKDRETATFLISSDSTATGEGTCRPAITNCQTIEMKAGESTFLDIDFGEGVRQFRLDVASIKETDAKDAKQASAARARMSVAGQEFLRSSIESGEVSLDGLDYSERTGTLSSTPRAKTAGPVARGAYRVDVKVGGLTRTDVRRLQVLPQRATARLLFLGVRDGGRSATFLNLEDLPVTGAACRPSPEDCERFTLRAGRTAHVGGVPVTVTELSLRRLASVSAAEQARTREDEAGRALVIHDDLDLGDLALDPQTGTLTRSPL